MRRSAGERIIVTVLALAVVVGCSPSPQTSNGGTTRSVGSVISRTPPDTSPAVAPDTSAKALPKLVKLEQEARALAKTEGCASVGSCRTAPLGWRGCGGPRTYLTYCAVTTDTVALFRKLAELEQAERDYNATSGMISTCEFRMPPGLRLDGRSCREGPAVP